MVLPIPLTPALFIANLDETIATTALPGIGEGIHACA